MEKTDTKKETELTKLEGLKDKRKKLVEDFDKANHESNRLHEIALRFEGGIIMLDDLIREEEDKKE